MTGQSGVDRQAGGFSVANLADHNYIRVLTKNLPQARSEIITDFRPHLRLV